MEDLPQKLFEEMRKEYNRSLNEADIEDKSDLKIAFPDLTVWFYNKDCQQALSEVKRIWEKVTSDKFGSKSLNQFLQIFSETLVRRHQRYLKLLKEAPLTKRLLDTALGVYRNLTLPYPHLKDQDIETLLNHNSLSFLEINDATRLTSENIEDLVPVYMLASFAEITDLKSAFEEGFEGYSLRLNIGNSSSETDVVDIRGNKAIWDAAIQLESGFKDKAAEVVLYEHTTRQFRPPKTAVATCYIDVYQYLLQANTEPTSVLEIKSYESSFKVEVPQKYMLMTVVNDELYESPKLAFSVYFNILMPEDKIYVITKRIKLIANKLAALKKEIERTNIKLVQQTAAFPTIRYDEQRLFISTERKSNYACFSKACAKKNKKQCEVM
ncbi:unnamed protein product [Blepharisma stoltei]|uniref:Uncharacterized protein n=1 Tax=Blepharisma stoltei TaxID=1481888 RepID=A0AAU9J9P6_9CILI|nr:unnamed protein product [Blepharisma stoltei]